MLVKSFAKYSASGSYNRFDVEGAIASQIDFPVVAPGIRCLDTGVDHTIIFSTEHRIVSGSFGLDDVRPTHGQKLCMPNWKPAPTWNEFAIQQEWNFDDWGTMAGSWRAMAESNAV